MIYISRLYKNPENQAEVAFTLNKLLSSLINRDLDYVIYRNVDKKTVSNLLNESENSSISSSHNSLRHARNTYAPDLMYTFFSYNSSKIDVLPHNYSFEQTMLDINNELYKKKMYLVICLEYTDYDLESKIKKIINEKPLCHEERYISQTG